MPLWLIITLIASAWIVLVAVIVIFMMGASRGRRKELAQDEADAGQAPLGRKG